MKTQSKKFGIKYFLLNKKLKDLMFYTILGTQWGDEGKG